MDILSLIGKRTIRIWNHYRSLFILFVKIIFALINFKAQSYFFLKKRLIERIYFTAIQPLPIVFFLSIVFGILISFLSLKLPNEIELGKLIIIFFIREFAPLTIVMLIILRSATAISIEFSHIKIFKEVEAIEMMGIDPIVLCIPVFLGIFVSICLLIFVFNVLALSVAYLITASVALTRFGNQIINSIGEALSLYDLVINLVKSFFFSAVISVVSTYRGLSAKNKIDSIIVTTSKSTMESFFLCVFLDFVISFFFYL